MNKSNLLVTAALLIMALIIIPVVAVFYDQPLSALQFQTTRHLVYGMLMVSLVCFILGELTKNYSQTDKLWSIMPLLYVAYVGFSAGWSDRLSLMTLLVAVWSIRLTYNFSRRGGYSLKFWEGEEDYRWTELRKEKFLQYKWSFTLFNLFFICLYQQALILAFTLPSILAMQSAEQPLGIFDIVLSLAFLIFVLIETIADQQQWNFQSKKHSKKDRGEVLTAEEQSGFISSGLWAKVRHPNYASEQSIWIVFYLFSVAATGRWINWSMVGCVLLVLLFQGSADFSENITAGKYPDYKDYQKRVPKFIPRFW